MTIFGGRGERELRKPRLHLPSVTEVLDCYTDWTHITKQTLRAAQARGTVVHDLAYRYASKDWIVNVPPQYQGYVDSFKKWFDAEVEQVVLLEERIDSRSHRFTGQLDMVVKLKGVDLPAVVDTKTAVSAGKTWGAQMCAYRWLVLTEKGILTGAPAHLRARAAGTKALLRTVDDVKKETEIFFKALELYYHFF